MIAIDVERLQANYDKKAVLWDVSFSLPSGSFLGIIGPNGAGKSTLLKAMLGLLPITTGRVLFFGKPLKDALADIAYIPQKESIDWDFPMTAKDLVLMGCYGKLGLFRYPSGADRDAAERALAQVQMDSYANTQIGQLSGGQQQRIFFARALMQEASILLLDEPFRGIDQTTQALLISILKDLASKGKTIACVHHDLESAQEYFSHIALLNIRLVAFGPTKETLTQENIKATYNKNYSLFIEASE